MERLLAELGTDLRTCAGRDLVALAQRWPTGRASRQQLRAAVAKAWDILERDQRPTLKAIRVPNKKRQRSLALEPCDAEKLEKAAYNRHDLPGLAVLIGLYAGLRREEIAALRWEDFISDGSGRLKWMTVHGKGDLEADIPVHPVLSGILEDWRRPTGWLFLARIGQAGHVNPATIWAWVRMVGDDAGVQVRPHILRHTALSEANDRSGDLRTVQSFARHAKPETTAGYTRQLDARLTKVVSMIDYGRKELP